MALASNTYQGIITQPPQPNEYDTIDEQRVPAYLEKRLVY